MISKHTLKRSSIVKAAINTLDIISRQYLVHNAVIMPRGISAYEPLMQKHVAVTGVIPL